VSVVGMVRGRGYGAYAQKASHTGGLDVLQLPVVAVPLEFPYEVPLVVPFTVLVQLDASRATRYGMVGGSLSGEDAVQCRKMVDG
jgi:hypothetical protein